MSPHLLYSQDAPPYFFCVNSDSYFYTKFKQIAFQLRRVRKTHRVQALRLKRKNTIIYTPGLKILNICDKYASVALNWIQISNDCKCSSKPSLSPFLAPSSFWCLQSFSSKFLEAPGEEKFLHPLTSLQPRPTLSWGTGRSHSTTASQEGEPALPWRDKSDLSTSRRIWFMISFLKILRLKFCSSA